MPRLCMITSWYLYSSRIAGIFLGDSTGDSALLAFNVSPGHRCIPLLNGQKRGALIYFRCQPGQSIEQTVELSVVADIMSLRWRRCVCIASWFVVMIQNRWTWAHTSMPLQFLKHWCVAKHAKISTTEPKTPCLGLMPYSDLRGLKFSASD